MRVWPGRPYPLGSTWDGAGINFALFSEHATRVERSIRGSDIKDISWFEPGGQEMSDEDWDAGFVKCLGVRLAGDLMDELDERGEPILGETLLLLLNAHHEMIPFILPQTNPGHCWQRLLDTYQEDCSEKTFQGRVQYPLAVHWLCLLSSPKRVRKGKLIESKKCYYFTTKKQKKFKNKVDFSFII